MRMRVTWVVLVGAGWAMTVLAACGSDGGTVTGGVGGSGATSSAGGQGSMAGEGSGGDAGTDAGGQGQGASSGTGNGGQGASSGTGSSGQGGTKPSDPCADCAGCCDGSTCLPLASQNKLSCGKGGGKCATCDEGETCKAGACVVDPSVCSPLSCPGCCIGNTCVNALSWGSCSKGGTTCQTCEPMALCTQQATCENDLWASDALIDLYIDQYSVSEAQCSDVAGAPDPTITVMVADKAYEGTCDDQYTCTFEPAWKIPNIKYGQFKLGQVKFSIRDVDGAVDDPCWGGTFPIPPRDLGTKVLKPGDGTVTYHLRPAGY